MSPSEGADRRPIARLALKRVASPSPERAPVFHVFEELYARASARPGENGERGAHPDR